MKRTLLFVAALGALMSLAAAARADSPDPACMMVGNLTWADARLIPIGPQMEGPEMAFSYASPGSSMSYQADPNGYSNYSGSTRAYGTQSLVGGVPGYNNSYVYTNSYYGYPYPYSYSGSPVFVVVAPYPIYPSYYPGYYGWHRPYRPVTINAHVPPYEFVPNDVGAIGNFSVFSRPFGSLPGNPGNPGNPINTVNPLHSVNPANPLNPVIPPSPSRPLVIRPNQPITPQMGTNITGLPRTPVPVNVSPRPAAPSGAPHTGAPGPGRR